MSSATTYADLLERRDALQNALDNGVRVVTYQGRTIEYRSSDEIRRQLFDLKCRVAELDGTKASASSKRLRQVYFATTKGTDKW